MRTNVLFILDLDRVLFDTERLCKTNHNEFAAYPEDKGALEKLKTFGKICVFSEITIHGSRDLQELKIKKLEIDKHVNNLDIHISEKKIEKLPEILKKYNHSLIFFVDDRIENLEAGGHLDPRITTVWVKRGIHAQRAMEKPQAYEPDLMVLNLSEFASVVSGMIKN